MNAVRMTWKPTRKATAQSGSLTKINFSSRRDQERDSRAVENSVEEQERWREGMVSSQVDTLEQLQASASQVEDATIRQIVGRDDQEEGRGASSWRHEIRDFERQL